MTATASAVPPETVRTGGEKAALPAFAASSNFHFSGHQTFSLRIAWIPKAVGAITQGLDPLTNIDDGITNPLPSSGSLDQIAKVAGRVNEMADKTLSARRDRKERE